MDYWRLFISTVAFGLACGCTSTAMYTPDGYLTEHGGKQTAAELTQIAQRCNTSYPDLSSARYACLRAQIPLYVRVGEPLAELHKITLDLSEQVARHFEEGRGTEDEARSILAEINEKRAYHEAMFYQRYDKEVSSRNARVQEQARQRVGYALMQSGQTLMKESSADSSRTVRCTRVNSSTVDCSEL